MQRQGFTLIELLVVIAVVAILAAFLFPVFSKARQKAQQMNCLSNEKQLASAVMQYTQDYDDMLPGALSGEDGDGLYGGWIYYDLFQEGADVTKGSLYTYVKSTAVFVCPADKYADQNHMSYGINSCLSSGAAPTGIELGKSLARFQETSAIMLFGEEAGAITFETSRDPATDSTDDGYFYEPSNHFSQRHSGGSNIVFLDTHAKWYMPTKAMNDKVLTGGANACP